MGLSPDAKARVTLSMPGEEPKCLCTKERGRSPQQKRKRACSSDLWDKGTLPGAVGGGHSHLQNGSIKLTGTQKPALPEPALKRRDQGSGRVSPGPTSSSLPGLVSPFNLEGCGLLDPLGHLQRGADGGAALGAWSVFVPTRAAGAAQTFVKGSTCGPRPSQQRSRSSGPAEGIRTPHIPLWPQRQLQPGLRVPERAFE